MQSPSVLITGAGGFVGGHLVTELRKEWIESNIIALDTNIESMPDSVTKYASDISKPETYIDVLKSEKPDWIIHLAAVSSVGFAIDHPEITRTVNVVGTEKLLGHVREISPHTKVLVVSSADIYGHGDSVPIAEKALADCHPANPYAQSKLEMEQIIEKDYSDMCIRVRPFPHIGPNQKKGFVTADFASQIAGIEAGKQDSVISVGNLTAIRDFTDVRDVVRAYRLLMEYGETGQVYNVASGKGTSIQVILDNLLAQSSAKVTVRQDPLKMRPSDNPVMIGDASRLTEKTGWRSVILLEQSLEDILTYWRNSI
ncbi:MAG: GDP-mannose 4,6-dehydratase [Candidatus Andersenbacteria bacterium]|nr:GDP-mannose 4,6-dehydratase [Candidatus Andersenbacteria bacterium]